MHRGRPEEDYHWITLEEVVTSTPSPRFSSKTVWTLLPFITRLCNTSIREACLPESQKRAIITPVIKKAGSDVGDVKNYHPHLGAHVPIQGYRENRVEATGRLLGLHRPTPQFPVWFPTRPLNWDGDPSHAFGYLCRHRSWPGRAPRSIVCSGSVMVTAHDSESGRPGSNPEWGQYTMRLRSLHRAHPSLHLFGVVHWVPEQLNIKAVTGACKLIDGCSYALCSATVSVVSSGICHRN